VTSASVEEALHKEDVFHFGAPRGVSESDFFQKDVPRTFGDVKNQRLMSEFRSVNSAVIDALQDFERDDSRQLLDGHFRIDTWRMIKILSMRSNTRLAYSGTSRAQWMPAGPAMDSSCSPALRSSR